MSLPLARVRCALALLLVLALLACTVAEASHALSLRTPTLPTRHSPLHTLTEVTSQHRRRMLQDTPNTASSSSGESSTAEDSSSSSSSSSISSSSGESSSTADSSSGSSSTADSSSAGSSSAESSSSADATGGGDVPAAIDSSSSSTGVKPANVRNSDDDTTSIITTVFTVIGVLLGVVCLERLYSSCRRTIKRRQGVEGFSQLAQPDGSFNPDITDSEMQLTNMHDRDDHL